MSSLIKSFFLSSLEDKRTDVGCQLEADVTPITLRSSLNALLQEMASNKVDPKNERVINSLEETLSSSLDDFNDGEGEGNEKNSLLRRMLLPMYRNRGDMMQSTQMSQMSQSPSRSVSGVKVENYSLIQVLLRMDTLQSELLTGLIQLLPEMASRFQRDDAASYSYYLEDVPRLLFQNLRWLDHIIDSASLITSFGECLSVLATTSNECSKTRAMLLDAIATLPDLLNDCNTFGMGGSSNEVQDILASLQDLRSQDESLLVPCLDAIDSMPLSPSDMENVMENALEALTNVETWGLPALTTFLINNCPKGASNNSMAKRLIEEFRQLPLGDATELEYETNLKGAKTKDTDALMIEALSRGFAHRMDLTSTLLKSIKETKQGYHKSVDIWLLACCGYASHNRTQVKTIFRTKATDGGFTSKMVREAIKGNGVALSSLFGTLLCDLADFLLRSNDGEVSELGITLYVVLFEEFKGEPRK